MTTGQAAYQEYLQTDKWKTIRAQRLAMDNSECVLCGNEAKHVHHRRYPKEWGTETVNDLVCLCETCHAKHHNDNHSDEIEIQKGRVLYIDRDETVSAAEIEVYLNWRNAIIGMLDLNIDAYMGNSIEQLYSKIAKLEEKLL